MKYVPDKTARDALKFFNLSEQLFLEREAVESQVVDGKVRKDIFHFILQSRDPETGKGFTRAQLHADANLLVAAGSDGVAIALSGSMFYLLRDPRVLEKLIREIRSSFSSVDDICLPKINALPYLNAVYEETLRMSPPIPSALPRTVMQGGLDVDGFHIPADIDVGVAAYAIHHNELYFPDPWTFQPERWLGNSEAVSAAKKAYSPFSVGPMSCIGKNVAHLAFKMALAKLLFVYDVRSSRGKLVGGGGPHLEPRRRREGEYQMKDWFVGYPTGPLVQFKTRNPEREL
jgi:cytochrome P450